MTQMLGLADNFMGVVITILKDVKENKVQRLESQNVNRKIETIRYDQVKPHELNNRVFEIKKNQQMNPSEE